MKLHKYLTYQALIWLHQRMFDLVCDEVEIPGEGQCDAVGVGFIKRSPRLAIVEVKVSRADFKADAKKHHRRHPSTTPTERYYLTPKDLLSPEELPKGWGLIEYDEEDSRCRLKKRCRRSPYTTKELRYASPDRRLLALADTARGREFIAAYLTVSRYCFYRYKDYVLRASGAFSAGRLLKANPDWSEDCGAQED